MKSKGLSIASDLSFSSLCRGITEFIDEYNFTPSNLEIGIEDIFNVIKIKEEFNMKDFYFSIKRDLPPYAWNITGYKDGEQCMICSPGI